MKISVVTVVYNRADTIGQAVESVLAQDYPNKEHVVQDGASTDGTLEILQENATDITSLESGKDGGIYEAINRGIERATGDVVGLMHSDDYFAAPDILSKVASAMADPTIDGVYGDLDYVSATDTSKIIRRWRSGAYDQSNIAKGWMPPHPTLYLRRDVFQKWGTYDTEFRIAADYEGMLRYMVKANVTLAYIPEVMVKMRVGGESNGSLNHILTKSREDLRALRRHDVGGLDVLARKNLRKVGQFFANDAV